MRAYESLEGNDVDPPTTAFPGESCLREPSRRSVLVFLPGEVAAGRFKVVRFLGQGGMGQVFEADDLELGAAVALKVIRPELSWRESSNERFKREVQLARQVTHPNVCRIFDIFQHRSRHAWGRSGRPTLLLTMELVRGETLTARLRRTGPLMPEASLALVRGMAGALDAAHDAGIVHRDFKSSNVLLAACAGGMRPVVTDFGAAQGMAEEPPARWEDSAATPAYAAPEVLAGRGATAPSDVYSFGLVLYEMLAGALPFNPGSDRRGANPPPLRACRPELDPVWEKVLARCLDARPERRFRRAGQAAEMLGAGLRNGTATKKGRKP